MFTYRQKIKTCNLDDINIYNIYEEFEKLPEPDYLLRPSDCGLCIGCIENYIYGGMENCKGPPNTYRLWYSEIKGLLTVIKNNYNKDWGIMSTMYDNAWNELLYYWKPSIKCKRQLNTLENTQILSTNISQNISPNLSQNISPNITNDNYYKTDYKTDYETDYETDYDTDYE
tara:strand:+ start:309 stop:824 length:516 start_codon:yes stop_codon:yes gene_type:complete